MRQSQVKSLISDHFRYVDINELYFSVWYILKKNYSLITVGENIKQRLKDFFLRKKKIKSFFRCSQRGISGSLPLRLKCAFSTELWRILVESQKIYLHLSNAQISAISHPKTLRCLWRHHHHKHEAKSL